METSPNIYQRMHAVMKSVSFVQKSSKEGFMYKFVTHDNVTALIRKELVEQGIIALTDITGHGQDGNRTHVDVAVSFVNIDKPEDRVTVNAFGYGIDPQDKGPGKAVSYAVKYAYLKAFALETGDDPERDSINHAPAPRGPPPSVIDRIKAAPPANGKQVNMDAFNALSTEAKQITREWAMEVIAYVENGEVPAAVDFIEAQDMDSEGKMALWSQLEAPIRTAITKEKERRRVEAVKKVPMPLASQA